jgi:hypothetical protein
MDYRRMRRAGGQQERRVRRIRAFIASFLMPPLNQVVIAANHEGIVWYARAINKILQVSDNGTVVAMN